MEANSGKFRAMRKCAEAVPWRWVFSGKELGVVSDDSEAIRPHNAIH